jgi:WD40 repeat protein
LALGAAGPPPSQEPGEPLPSDEPEWLSYAQGYAADLLAVLQQFDYAAYPGQDKESEDLARTGRALSDSVEEVIEQSQQEGTSAVIVHVLGHGTVTSDHLYVHGNDGSRSHNHVETWLGWVQDHEGARPHTLFILDICRSGEATRQSWLEFTPAAARRAWVIAACRAEEEAFNGRLTRALIDVLQKYGSLDLRIDPAHAYIPLDTFIQEIRRELDQAQLGGLQQHVETSRIELGELGTSLADLPFFKNKSPLRPARTMLSSRLDAAARALLDTVPDAWYFMDRAGGGSPSGGEQAVGFFEGRRDQLHDLSAWMNGAGGAVKVVTGKPGVGKSALLGILVCAAHPKLRDATHGLWGHLPHPPPLLGDRFCALHARQRTPSEVTGGLARQLGLGSVDTADQLVAEIAGLAGEVPVILIDAVDEARDASGLVNVLLLRLATACRADGTPACRLLIGSRSEPWLDGLIEAGGPGREAELDLGSADPDDLRTALTDYLNRVLGVRGPYATATLVPVREHLAASVADILTGRDGGDGTPAWGEFLVAGLFAHHLLASESARSLEEAEQLAASVPRDLPGVLRLDQSRQDAPWMRPILAAVAHAYGEGMSEPLIELAIPAVRPAHQRDVTPTRQDMHDALDQAEFYLRRSVDTDGRTLYRLFHQGLTDRLRQEPWEPEDGIGAETPEVVGPLFEALTCTVVKAGHPGTWRSAWPYLLRHASEHAVDAGRLDDLLSDPEFLVHADPVILARHLHQATSAPARRVAAIHRASYLQHHRATPEVRREILAVDAARFGHPEWARDLVGVSKWRLKWATGGQVSSALLATLAGHAHGARAVATAQVAGRPAAVTADGDGTVRVWDLRTSEVTATLAAHSGWINGVACYSPDNAPLALTASEDRTVRIWDLATGQAKVTLRGHGDSVSAVASATVCDRNVVLTASDDDTARVWDPASGQVVFNFSEHTNAVTGVACSVVNGRPVAVTTSNDGTARVWDIETGQVITTHVHTDPLRGVACTIINGQPVAITTSDDGTARAWDIETGRTLAVLAGHTGPVIAVACTRLYGRSVAITTSDDDTARVWDLTLDQEAPALSEAHARPIRALALMTDGSPPTVVSGSADGTVRLWDLASGQHMACLTGHAHPVNSVDATKVQGRLVVTSTSDDGSARIWDLADAANPIQLNGYTNAVTTGTCVVRAGTPVLVTTSGTMLHVWDLSTVAPGASITPDTTALTGHSDPVNAAAHTEINGRPVVITVSNEPTVRIWDPMTGKVIGHLSHHRGRVLAVACATLGGRPVAVTGGDDAAIIWDLANAEVLSVLDGHPGPVTAVTCTVTGEVTTALTGSDNSVRAWDTATGQLLGTFNFPYPVHALCAGPLNEIVVATGQELVAMTFSNRDLAEG